MSATAALIAAQQAERIKASLAYLRERGATGRDSAVKVTDEDDSPCQGMDQLAKSELVVRVGENQYYLSAKGAEILDRPPEPVGKIVLVIMCALMLATTVIVLIKVFADQ